MSREILGKVGLGYSHCEVGIVTDPDAGSMMGLGMVFLNVEHFGADKAKIAVALDGEQIDELILALREGKRRLLAAGAARK